MRKSLILPLALALAIPAMGAPLAAPSKVKGHVVTGKADVKTSFNKAFNKKINPLAAAKSAGFSESFERPDKTWPEGWTATLENENDWMIFNPSSAYGGIASPDGLYSAMGTCMNLHNASWLISPEFTVSEGDQLMFQLYFDVRALYEWTTTGENKNIDEEDGLILNRVNAENMKICISVDGGEWITLQDLWETYGKLGYWEIMYDYELPEFRKFSFPLSEYAGKTVKIGFCHSYLSTDGGHGMFLDAIEVGLPPVEASYSLPFGTLFWGMSNDLQAYASWAMLPYYTDMTWINETIADEGTTWNWTYEPAMGGEAVTSTESDLTTNYTPDYTENPESTYTLFSFPTLTATAPSGSTGAYTYSEEEGAYVFAGIAAELPTRDGGMIQLGLSTFDQADEIQLYNADFSTPAWGRSAMTQDWWTNHYFQGEQQPDDYAKVTSNINFFYSMGAPIVIDGVRVAAVTECDPDAEFKMELVELTEEFEIGTVLATATVKGSDLFVIDESIATYPDQVIIPFTFDTPVVIDGVNFIARLSGFDSDKVSYYAPLQSYKSAPLCYGFSTVEIFSPSMGSTDPGESLIPTAVFEDLNNSFAFYLDARMPYLKCNEDKFEATADQTEKTFEFDSSYSADNLTVADENGTIPEWLNVEKTGQFGNTRIKVSVTEGAETPQTAKLNVTAPGVSHMLTIKQHQASGIGQITENGSQIMERQWFDMTGRRLKSEPSAGAFIVKNLHSNGSVTVEKVIK